MLIQNCLLSEKEVNELLLAAPISHQLNHRLNKKKPQTLKAGEQLSDLNGSGTDFAEVRAYQAGDDIRRIDWRATARSQHALVRTYHQEVNYPFCIVIDQRSSMQFATRVRLKIAQALRLALWIGGKEARQGREIKIVILDEANHWLPAQASTKRGLQSLNLMAKLINTSVFSSRSLPPSSESAIKGKQENNNWNTIFSGIKNYIARGSELFIISDFFQLSEKHQQSLQALSNHCQITAVEIYDVSEKIAGFDPSIQLQGSNSRLSFSSSELSEALRTRDKKLKEQFKLANINLSHLSVEEEELNFITHNLS